MFDVSCHDHEGVKIIMTEFCPILMSYENKKVEETYVELGIGTKFEHILVGTPQ